MNRWVMENANAFSTINNWSYEKTTAVMIMKDIKNIIDKLTNDSIHFSVYVFLESPMFALIAISTYAFSVHAFFTYEDVLEILNYVFKVGGEKSTFSGMGKISFAFKRQANSKTTMKSFQKLFQKFKANIMPKWKGGPMFVMEVPVKLKKS